jgi:hypothetical protein
LTVNIDRVFKILAGSLDTAYSVATVPTRDPTAGPLSVDITFHAC